MSEDDNDKEKELVESLFDLDYHEVGTVRQVQGEHEWTKVMRVPNGWIYIIQTSSNLSTSFVPEYIPTPPPEKEETDLLDAELCDFLNSLLTNFSPGHPDTIKANRLIRQVQRRNKPD